MPEKYPTTLVLRHNKLWFEVPGEDVRRYLQIYLNSPHWRGKTWDEIKNSALIPENAQSLQTLFAVEAKKKQHIMTLLEEIKSIDAEIDERVLDLYGITNQTDRQRILGSAPLEAEVEEAAGDDEEKLSLDSF